jgi:2-keto-3-deoxy-L-rhamnonate aldolase RhmA
MSPNSVFKKRLTGGQHLLGAFIKTPHPIVIEVMGANSFDFLVIDGEHAPFDRTAIDNSMIAGRAVDCPLIVRVPSSDPAMILAVLDSGAAGVMVPHVISAKQAKELVLAVSYRPGGRGFAGTTRAAGYGARKLTDHLTSGVCEVCLICQIEDPEGVKNAAEIAAVEGVDALFVGRADLAVSYAKSDFFDPDIANKAAEVLGVAGAATGLYCALSEKLDKWKTAGGSMFVIGSDHSLMMQGAADIAARFKDQP